MYYTKTSNKAKYIDPFGYVLRNVWRFISLPKYEGKDLNYKSIMKHDVLKHTHESLNIAW